MELRSVEPCGSPTHLLDNLWVKTMIIIIKKNLAFHFVDSCTNYEKTIVSRTNIIISFER